MVELATAPEWIDSEVCMRCRIGFSFTTRKHHCRNCGNVYCATCSSKTLPLPHLGIMEPVRVDDGCHSRLIERFKYPILHSKSSSLQSQSRYSPSSSSLPISSENSISRKKTSQKSTDSRSKMNSSSLPSILFNSTGSGSSLSSSFQTEDSSDADLKRALEMSLEESQFKQVHPTGAKKKPLEDASGFIPPQTVGQQFDNQTQEGYQSHQYNQKSPKQHNQSETNGWSDSDWNPDYQTRLAGGVQFSIDDEESQLKAAIAASLADVEAQRQRYNSHQHQHHHQHQPSSNPNENKSFANPSAASLKNESTIASGFGISQQFYNSPESHQKSIIHSKSYELTTSEAEKIEQFSTLIDRLHQQPAGAILRELEIHELYENIGNLRTKLARSYGETVSKHDALLNLHAKLSTVVRYYDRMLEEQLSNAYKQDGQHYPQYLQQQPYRHQYQHGETQQQQPSQNQIQFLPPSQPQTQSLYDQQQPQQTRSHHLQYHMQPQHNPHFHASFSYPSTIPQPKPQTQIHNQHHP